MPDRICQRPGCGNPITSKRSDARWCSTDECKRIRMAAYNRIHYHKKHPNSVPRSGPVSHILGKRADKATIPGYKILSAKDWPEGVVLGRSQVKDFLANGSFDVGDRLLDELTGSRYQVAVLSQKLERIP